jgi:hypothetical protein
VHLSPRLWSGVRQAARKRHVTYSWITRFCAFRLIERQALRTHRMVGYAKQQVQKEKEISSEKHRHLVCFYGEDIKFVRYAALELGISVSVLIRIALWCI